MYGRKEVFVVTQVDGEIVFQIVAMLLGLVIGETVFSSVVGVIPEPSVHNMLSNTVGQALGIVIVGSIFSLLYALDQSRIG